MQRSDTIRLHESFFDRFCRILLSFFFSFSRHVQYRLQKKKKISPYFHSLGKYFKSTNILISSLLRYIHVEFDKNKLLQFYFSAYSPKRTQKLIYQVRVQEE